MWVTLSQTETESSGRDYVHHRIVHCFCSQACRRRQQICFLHVVFHHFSPANTFLLLICWINWTKSVLICGLFFSLSKLSLVYSISTFSTLILFFLSVYLTVLLIQPWIIFINGKSAFSLNYSFKILWLFMF